MFNIMFYIRVSILGILFGSSFPAFSAPDLTIVGFFEPEGGLGKVPLTICECLDNSVSINFIETQKHHNYQHNELPAATLAAIHNTDKEAGRVALLTDTIWDISRKASNKMPKDSIVKYAYSMLETSCIPSMWVTILNTEFDGVVVPDKFLAQVYQDCGVIIPIFVLPIPMDLSPYLNYTSSKHPSKPFVFGDASVNKNPKILLEAFAKAFGNNPKVSLFVRSGGIDQNTKRAIIEAKKKYKLKNITVDSGKIPASKFIPLVEKFDCYINLSRGEGFSLIPREMLALGIPVIITDNTASTTICESGFVCSIPSNIKNPSNIGYKSLFGESCGEQFDCKVNDVITAMQDVYNNYQAYRQLAEQGREWVKQYDISNSDLKLSYQTLVKPNHIILGDRNEIVQDTLITTSESLYEKYKSFVSETEKNAFKN